MPDLTLNVGEDLEISFSPGEALSRQVLWEDSNGVLVPMDGRVIVLTVDDQRGNELISLRSDATLPDERGTVTLPPTGGILFQLLGAGTLLLEPGSWFPTLLWVYPDQRVLLRMLLRRG